MNTYTPRPIYNSEITEMLNGTIPAIAGVRCCWCNTYMKPRYAGEPCVTCLVEQRHQELLEETAADYTIPAYWGVD